MYDNSFFYVVALVMFLGAIIVILILGPKEKNDKPQTDNPEDNYRIVELNNGKFKVEEYSKWKDCWDSPDILGPYIFDTIQEARARINRLLEQEKENKGYRVKRIITNWK